MADVALLDATITGGPLAARVPLAGLRFGVSAVFWTIFFPTVPVLPPKIDPVNGTGTISINGGPQVDAFTTVIRNMAPGSCAGVPSLSIPAGLATSGLPSG